MQTGHSALPPGIHHSRLFWLGLLSLAFLLFARIGSGAMSTGACGGPFIAFSARDRVVIVVNFAVSQPAASWRRPDRPGEYSPEFFDQLGYSQWPMAPFTSPPNIFHIFSLPYGLLIAIATLLFSILVYLRQRRHERHLQTLREIDRAATPPPPAS